MAWSGNKGSGPKLPTWYPSSDPTECRFTNPPGYGQPAKQGNNGDYWASTVSVAGTEHKWWISPKEMDALTTAGRPAAGVPFVARKGSNGNLSVQIIGGGQPPPQPAAQGGYSAPSPSAHGSEYSCLNSVKAHIWFLSGLLAEAAKNNINLPPEQAAGMATSQMIEWHRQGRPPYRQAQSADARDFVRTSAVDDGEDVPF